jgi:large subunit ribosomal protein L25
MAEKRKLSAKRRTVIGKQVGQLRRAGLLPAVVYGPGAEPTPIEINAREAARELRYVQGSELVELDIDGEVRNVLLQDLQRDSLRGHFLHVDFYAVDMSRRLKARIPVRLTGTSFAVNSLNGVMVRGLTEVEVEALPGDLIPLVEADLSVLREIGMAIHVGDLALPQTLTLLTNAEELIARVTAARTEELAPTTTPTTAEVEVIEKGKEEEEGEEE